MKTLLLVLLMALMPQQRPLSDIASELERIALELRQRPEVIAVHEPTGLAAAIASAKAGDTILLDPGVRYVGALTLGTNTGVVTIRSAAYLPSRRIGPADAPLLPIIASGNTGPAITGVGAANWVIDGVQVESTASGAGDAVVFQDGFNIYLDRVLLVAGPNGQKRGIRGNGRNVTLTRSYIANIWAAGQDSQAFAAWDGAGPYTLTDNYLEAASENVMFGGADSQSVDRIPSDILVDGNYFTKRLEWKPIPPATVSGKVVKNLFELKSAKRVVVTNNIFENNWTDAQDGYGISFKSVNQNSTAPWSVTQDVRFENNVVRNVEKAFKIQGFAADQPGGRTTGIVIRSNDVQTPGVAISISGAPGTIVIDRDTFTNGYTFLQLSGGPIDNLTVTGVLANHNAYGVKGDATGIGTASLVKFATLFTWANNVLLGGAGKGTYPPTTWFDLASVPAGTLVGR